MQAAALELDVMRSSSVSLGVPQDCKYTVTGRCRSWNNKNYRGGLRSKLMTGAKIITAPVWKHVMKGRCVGPD